MNTKERLREILGDLKNWDWDKNPQYKIDKEAGKALVDIMYKRKRVGRKGCGHSDCFTCPFDDCILDE